MDVDACTLPTAERPLRLAEIDALFATAARSVDRLDPRHLRLSLAGGEELTATVRDLTDRESACCSFFGFTVTPAGDAVTLDVTVPDAYVHVLDALAARAAAARS
jgi:hypothetical protein